MHKIVPKVPLFLYFQVKPLSLIPAKWNHWIREITSVFAYINKAMPKSNTNAAKKSNTIGANEYSVTVSWYYNNPSSTSIASTHYDQVPMLHHRRKSIKSFHNKIHSFFKGRTNHGLFLFISSFSQYNFNNPNCKKHRWWAWDSNPQPHDCRRRWYHGAMAAAY